MSDLIPFDIQVEIIKRLPIRSLLRFLPVSKPWKSLIESPKFIADYQTRRHDHCVLIRYVDCPTYIEKYVSIVDDDSFPQHNFPLTVPLSTTTSQGLVDRHVSISTSQGLVCFCITDRNHSDPVTRTVVLWNPAIRKSVDIAVGNVLFRNRNLTTFIGFGVSPHTNEPMLVKITYMNSDTISCIPQHIEVFKLSTGVWRSLCTNLPRKSIRFSRHHVAIDRSICWIGVDVDGRMRNMIMSFDMEREDFTEISLPDYLACLQPYNLNISKLRESLVVLETDKYSEKKEHVVWLMEHGVSNSFRKLYSIKAPDASIRTIFGFRKSGEPIIEWFFNVGERHVTSVYDPCSKCFNDIMSSDNAFLYSVSSYTETLLLLDH